MHRESLPEDLDPDIAFPPKEKKAGHIIEPLRKYRGAQPFEQLRMRTEKWPEKPVVFLLTYGNLNEKSKGNLCRKFLRLRRLRNC